MTTYASKSNEIISFPVLGTVDALSCVAKWLFVSDKGDAFLVCETCVRCTMRTSSVEWADETWINIVFQTVTSLLNTTNQLYNYIQFKLTLLDITYCVLNLNGVIHVCLVETLVYCEVGNCFLNISLSIHMLFLYYYGIKVIGTYATFPVGSIL